LNKNKKQAELQSLIRTAIYKKSANRCVATNKDGSQCTESAISSHTIQKGGGLAAIAENGHVYQIQHANNQEGIPTRKCQFTKTGLKKASVFPGFCARHDNYLFRSAEQQDGKIELDDLILLGYRIICMELFKKERIIRIYEIQRVKELGIELGLAESVMAFLHGTRLAVIDLKRQKEAYEVLMAGKNTAPFYASIFQLKEDLPFTFASAFAPEFDFSGGLILPPPTMAWGSATVYVGRVKNKPVASFQSLDIVEHHNIASFFSSQAILPLEKIGGLLLQFAVEYSENSFFKISWVDDILPEIRQDLLERFRLGTPGEPNQNKARISNQYDIVRVAANDVKIFSPAPDPP
tara:strand:+ start:19679 stop:20728 length:1050 start_codon:yes stop_codon:yes gene_type:complete